MLPPIPERIAQALGVRSAQVTAAANLLDGGATVPFVARYRKEATGGLDDGQLRLLEERLAYLRELEARRGTVLKSIEQQGELSPELKTRILAAETKTALEDLYLPYKPKRRTRAQIAREAGLEPLAHSLLADPAQVPPVVASGYVNPARGVADEKAALDGARQILMEEWAEDAVLAGELREWLWNNARLEAKVEEGKQEEGAKFKDYFGYNEAIKTIPSHRALALLRGRGEGVLRLTLEEPDAAGTDRAWPEAMLAARFGVQDRGRAADTWLQETVRYAWRVKLFTRLELELKARLREAAEEEAIRVFARNLQDLLLAAPAGQRATLGLDPGLRTGVKAAVVDNTGRLLDTATVYPHPPRNQWRESIVVLARLVEQHRVELVAIGNGTASRETERLAAELIRDHPQLRLTKIRVSEAGASVYSASELAARELPGVDVSLRGGVSIARRLQDPLAELVKIDPKSIGVGQYQHDVSQVKLARSLENVVEDCVNAVGVDLNTASPALLARVSGLTATLAANIVSYRDTHGAFRDRRELLNVSRLGEKAFEQAAGFLRITNGRNPLDASAVHPEAYPVVDRILSAHGRSLKETIGDIHFVDRLHAADYTSEHFGLPTVKDILAELRKPGRDPRPEFQTATFRDGVEDMADLTPGMVLEGVVTNVAAFGAFIDVGVHQDGLVHISAMSEKFVRDPRSVVKAGDVVKVKVMGIDLRRKRISLSMRLDDEPEMETARRGDGGDSGRPSRRRRSRAPEKSGALAEAFAKAGLES
ncbi:MAG: Tex family protein [Gammaproteobacteria bacterium]|nr:Tex family protein [Gammaproteobacteria bacterium]